MSGQIHEEIQQSKPMSVAVEAALNIHRTSTVLREMVEAVAQSAGGMRHIEYNILRILRGAGAEGASIDKIRERLIWEEPNMLGILGLMLNRGWVARLGHNRGITKEGLAVLATLDSQIDDVLNERMKRLPNSDIRKLIESLETLR